MVSVVKSGFYFEEEKKYPIYIHNSNAYVSGMVLSGTSTDRGTPTGNSLEATFDVRHRSSRATGLALKEEQSSLFL